jgi:ABC-2 type transport system permease protein
MMIHLVNKDFLLMKRYLPLTAVLAFAIPLFLGWQVPSIMGFTAFMITVIFTVYIPLQSVSLAETKYPKTTALLCTAPYTRSAIVKARYIFFLILFIFCYLAYVILSLLVPQVKMIRLFDIILVLLVFSIIFGIYMPLQYKLGFEKMKYVLMVVLFGTSFLLPSIVKVLVKVGINFDLFNNLPLPICYVALMAAIFVVVSISLTASIKIFQAKEL